MLNVSYQAARNYLDGRLPEARVLRSIAERTPYSINWLLTGEGDKFVRNVSAADDGLRLTEPMRTVIRQVCLEIFAEFVGSAEKSSEPKIIKLTADKIKEETLLREPAFHPESDR